MMDSIFEGIKIGLVLCFLLGPIFVALVQTGVEEGILPGTVVGSGIWISDLLFILAVYWGIGYVRQLVQWDNFTLALGIGGSITLAAFGLGTLLSKPPEIVIESKTPIRISSWAALWMKGFLINTINPFTVFFWLGLMAPVLIKEESLNPVFFFGGILGTIIVTDFLKVVLAKYIRKHMRPVHILWLRRISGMLLILFGVILLLRVLFTDTSSLLQ